METTIEKDNNSVTTKDSSKMAFELENTVPWGRNLGEYKAMFNLTGSDLDKRIISFGDGPASFNCEMSQLNKSVVSIDPIYRFSTAELKGRIEQTKDTVMEQTRKNSENFVWTRIKSADELETIRLSAMDSFLDDFEAGKSQGRYVNHQLPDRTPFDDLTFELGLSSHFLILYSQLGLDFHLACMTEMLRVAKQIRIFPLLDLDAKRSELLDSLVEHFRTDYRVGLEKTGYEFQKKGDQMLTIKRR
ncbi:SAM-dependent methyltransferase [Cytophagaceae bacterium YF14B1]|uniref:SAM-dependent methyltransferase n=1 Tax=Xanthocytophaga flava TaxID=3048013 RepID=A0AAE3QUX8_9BACT|nr:SAM-dependent methyltransferase [Xanthocytophaga flavus]MDJ1485937.1 SAM-dependent methyltransferase [Xanthocytophaga flavus]